MTVVWMLSKKRCSSCGRRMYRSGAIREKNVKLVGTLMPYGMPYADFELWVKS